MSEIVMAGPGVETPIKVKPRRTRIGDKERQKKALELRKAGLQWWQIADALGYADEESARRSVSGAINRIPEESAREKRQIDELRMQHMLSGIWNRAVNGDLNAIDRVLKISERLAHLYGYALEETNVVNNTAVLVVQGTENEYVNALRAARNEAPLELEVADAEEVEDEEPPPRRAGHARRGKG